LCDDGGADDLVSLPDAQQRAKSRADSGLLSVGGDSEELHDCALYGSGKRRGLLRKRSMMIRMVKHIVEKVDHM
jgi:hypothetical protein